MSSPLLMKVTSYFTPPQHYFWRWADKGNVIEWKSGVSTICYREELVEILLQMADKEGMPPLGAVLLVLAACKGDHSKVNIWSGILFELFGKAIADKDVTYADTLKQNTFRALQLMESIIALPAEYRTGDKRHWLMHTIFAQAEKISPAMSFAMLHEFRSGKLDNYIFKDGFESFVETFYSDMQCLGGAGRTFETTGSLELRLRTGLSSIPVAVPEIETPQEKPADLLDQLSQDEKTSGLASLTRRLVAALNIPMHAYGQSDQSFGGVSDISNRGNFDRLLLSELAHDDLSLMARLANNEALYLRREELPDELDRERVILIDTTIKMWGRPRLFAIATALACARNNKLNAAVHGYALGGKHVTPADLSSKEGIIQVMGQLDASLHCGKALSDTMKNVRGGEGDEYFLVTEESNIHTEAFHKAVAELKNPLSFLLTVDRNGQLHFYEFIKGRRKLLSTAKFDLEDILEEKKPLRKEHLREVQDLPAIMKLHHFPLYLPTSKLYFHDTRIAITDIGIIAVTMDHRLLYWPERSKGAIELMEYIERAWYCFGHSGKDDLYVLCYHNGMGKNPILHNINLSRRTIRSTAMEGDFHHVEDAEFDDGNFRIMVKNEFYVVDPRTATAAVSAVPMRAKIHRPGTNMNSVKKFVNNGYTVINTVRTMHLNRDGQITLESRYLKADHQSIRLVQCHRDSSKITARLSPGVHGFVSIGHENKHVKFFRFVWKDGSIALFDSRGLLHLRSSDPSIPEITIVTVMEKSLACWASNGDVCGSKYFTGGPEDWFTSRKHISVMAFYNQYIQPFIDTLR